MKRSARTAAAGFATLLATAIGNIAVTSANGNTISTGYMYSSAKMEDGSIILWGGTSDGKTTTFKRDFFEGPAVIETIGGGYSSPLILASDKKLCAWDIESGNLYLVTDSVAQFSMYSNHLLVLKTDGSLWARGNNAYSQLGDGTVNKRDDLVLVYKNE